MRNEELSQLLAAVFVRLEVPNKDGWMLGSFDHYFEHGNYMFYRVFRKSADNNTWIIWEEKPWVLIKSTDVPSFIELFNDGQVANDALIALLLNRITEHEIFPVEPGKTLSDLIDDCIAAKEGNTNFNLMGYGSVLGNPPWRAEIGNDSAFVAHTHSDSEHYAYGNTPEEAVVKLIQLVKFGANSFAEAVAAE